MNHTELATLIHRITIEALKNDCTQKQATVYTHVHGINLDGTQATPKYETETARLLGCSKGSVDFNLAVARAKIYNKITIALIEHITSSCTIIDVPHNTTTDSTASYHIHRPKRPAEAIYLGEGSEEVMTTTKRGDGKDWDRIVQIHQRRAR